MSSMPLVFFLRRAFDLGTPVGSAKIFISARGTLRVGEARDEQFKRVVRSATFTRLDGGEPVPDLRDVEILQWSHVFVLKGVELICDDRLSRPRLYAQTWQLVPEPYEELEKSEQVVSRLVSHLRTMGVPVQMLPDGAVRIPGEKRSDGHPLESA